ncbi:Putative protein in type-1 retrotransposable element R1DM [Araneus ventricosus]|uniref:Retrovirus-related Pol polyprotein from type-1 retrotransposable element R1 n=1 Tax=Araneus ventricosus TaxID=182803 RepID=A0A4Y2LRF2_ARAVE|nr:Putative protein in type-1 retrotransposable element R1DM [Araneus ventricosus]
MPTTLQALQECITAAVTDIDGSMLLNVWTELDYRAFKTQKKKPKKFAKKFSFWNEDLRISRNKVNRLFKTYIKHKTEGSILEIIQSSGNAYRKERAIYKKLLLSTKRKAWESFCLNHNERFGFLFNLVFNRGSSENFIGVNPNNDPNNTIEDKINYLMDNFFPSPSSEDNLDYTPIIGHVEPMVLEDIEMVINALKGGKAPGLDRIDFRMWRAVFIHDKEFILDLINICFKFNYFPEHLRNAKVFFLLKDGKDPSLCTSYRPVCLLPTLGKIIERLFLLQLNKWLDRNNIIHHNQYGFREGKSCDLAIHDLIETIKIRMPSEHLALVSLDIKSAFDTMNWPVLFKTLESYGFPAFFKNFIYFYLKNRRVFYTNDVLEISRPCSKGCPQGCVIAPTIWNIYINSILINDRPDLHIQAFADDLVLLIGGRTARELENKTNLILAAISDKLEDLKLKLSIEKCQAVVYRSIASQKFSKRNSTVLNRKPTFKIKNHSIKVSDSLKILGITIDNKLSWTAHFLTLHAKALFLTSNFNRVVKSKWNVNKNLLKIWYYTVIEKALLYGASVWGGALTKNQIDRLHRIQRIFLLKFTRAFRTSSTNVLNVLTGIPPLHIVAKAEFIKFRIWVNRSNEYNTIFDINLLDKYVPLKNIPSRQKLINLDSKISNADYEIYTDGSRIENETGFAVCILKDEINIQNYLFKLNTFNSVFQAELAAIEFAVNWAVKEKVKVNIHSDSLSSISAINSANTRSEFFNKVKSNIFRAKNMVGLSWVKAHVGIPGNELADQQAKLAITSGEKFVIPAPYSHLKGLLKNYIVNEWNEYWNSYDSASGIRVRGYINQVSPKFLIHNKFLIYFLSGHGPFPSYLHRFKFLDSPHCICGLLGDADHYIFSCSLTKEFHLIKPADEHKKVWFNNLLTNRQAVTKMEGAFRTSRNICDTLSQERDHN